MSLQAVRDTVKALDAVGLSDDYRLQLPSNGPVFMTAGDLRRLLAIAESAADAHFDSTEYMGALIRAHATRPLG